MTHPHCLLQFSVAVYGHADLLDLLEDRGADLEAQDRYLARPVHYAAQMRDASAADGGRAGLTMLKKLIGKGISVDVEDVDKRSQLLWAVTAGMRGLRGAARELSWLWEFYVLCNFQGHISMGHQLVTVHTHGNFVSLSHWQIRPPVP